MTHQKFIEAVAGYVRKFAPDYGIRVCSPIIAQAILESGWGESKLAEQYHNYFGLKCGSRWTGKSVNLKTKEEYTLGTLTEIRDNFRVFDSMEEGVKGYFEFIQLARYQNLRGITDPEEYLKTIKADGYATSSAYVENNMKIIRQYGLTRYDEEGNTVMAKTAEALIAQARAWIGCKESDGSHRKIIDIYNSHEPLARGYKVKYTDAWCATFVSACAIKTGMTDIIPTECGCGEMVKLFQKLGEWDENDARVPKPGDIIFYDWQDPGSGNNTGNPDHVGIVENVSGNTITVIEGNKNDAVGRRTLKVNGRYIRGYGVVKYDSIPKTAAATITVEQAARNVIAGKYGNGEDRKKAIAALDLDYAVVQKRVNELLRSNSGSSAPVYYTVQRGDTLSAIAKKYGTTVSAIQKLNSSLIKNVNVIQTGWKIRVK